MKNIGIVAEYNPFHNGHAYHIEQARKIAGGGSVIAVMSASFVQRGEPAAFDKFTRTAMALQGGADMVLELPDILSLACAERFALGGVRILSASGIADRLCFGSESGDIDALRRAADSKLSGDELSSALSSGLSYPAAAAMQLRAHGIGVGSNNPNDVLGIEYIRALKRIAPAIRPFTVCRIGCGYNESTLPENYASASAVRSALLHLTDSENACCTDVLSAISGSVPPFVLFEIQK
ncbi:MAG TPA: hypothetical protein DCY17_01135, partial [Clostridiales bacterium]|nr:hypothetical protein [Clostridiales bacterium]